MKEKTPGIFVITIVFCNWATSDRKPFFGLQYILISLGYLQASLLNPGMGHELFSGSRWKRTLKL